MSNDHIIYRFWVALFTRTQLVGVIQACRQFKVHRSTHYDRLAQVKL